MQVPPMYSAIKIKGEKLYELARKGLEVERSARLPHQPTAISHEPSHRHPRRLPAGLYSPEGLTMEARSRDLCCMLAAIDESPAGVGGGGRQGS